MDPNSSGTVAAADFDLTKIDLAKLTDTTARRLRRISKKKDVLVELDCEKKKDCFDLGGGYIGLVQLESGKTTPAYRKSTRN